MSLQLHRPTPDGLEPSPVETRNWRGRLRSRRWRPAELSNPEAETTNPFAAVLLIGALAFGTFVVLLLGYGTGFWGAPG